MEGPSAFDEWCFAGKESNVETKPTSVCVHIRWMIRRDMPAVLGIENACFEFAWNEEDFIRCLRQRNCIGMVAEEDDQVVGFMIYELHKNRLHILNFAVHPSHRRSGIGRAMINKLLGKLSHERRNRIMLEVRETNLVAQLFFKCDRFPCDFGASRFLRRYGRRRLLDAVSLSAQRRRIGSSPQSDLEARWLVRRKRNLL